ncbi:MAG: PAS domain-containing sensor histidine kinase [Thermodesulfobacteriota bacterium]
MTDDNSYRKRAESLVRGDLIQNLKEKYGTDSESLLHELAVRQIEIELRNKELRKISKEMENGIRVRKQPEKTFKKELGSGETVETALPCGICLADHEGCILYVNQRFCRLFGYLENELSGCYPPSPLKDFFKKRGEGDFDIGRINEYSKKNGGSFLGLSALTPVNIPGHELKGFLAIVLEVSKRKTVDDAFSTPENRSLAFMRKFINAREDEQARLSKDIHDSIGSSLVAVRFLLERKLKELGDGDRGTDVPIEYIIEMVQGLVVETRRISQDLYPRILEQLGLQVALTSLCDHFRAEYSTVTLTYDLDLDETALSWRLKLLVYRLMQDGLSNVAAHSRADHVSAAIKNRPEFLEFKLEDNGVGFDMDQVMDSGFSHESTSIGIESMRARVESSGGRFTVFSKEGDGARIQAEWGFSE